MIRNTSPEISNGRYILRMQTLLECYYIEIECSKSGSSDLSFRCLFLFSNIKIYLNKAQKQIDCESLSSISIWFRTKGEGIQDETKNSCFLHTVYLITVQNKTFSDKNQFGIVSDCISHLNMRETDLIGKIPHFSIKQGFCIIIIIIFISFVCSPICILYLSFY